MGHPLALNLFRLQACVLCENCNPRHPGPLRYVGFDDFDGCGGDDDDRWH